MKILVCPFTFWRIIMTEAVLNICMQVFLAWICLHFTWVNPEVKLLDHIVRLWPAMSFEVTVPQHSDQQLMSSPTALHSWQHLLLSILRYSYFNRCIMVSHFCFSLKSLNGIWCWVSSYAYFPYIFLSWKCNYSDTLTTFKLYCWYSYYWVLSVVYHGFNKSPLPVMYFANISSQSAACFF